ncbi:hypothetical protein, partial [Solirhodobacter olei]|uniref:hypothetical protein n=1 Tax=Solirhodobacter olei TaxID=2493082 RepID=UPI0013E3177A
MPLTDRAFARSVGRFREFHGRAAAHHHVLGDIAVQRCDLFLLLLARSFDPPLKLAAFGQLSLNRGVFFSAVASWLCQLAWMGLRWSP